ncbi:MAG: hypothetical protein WAL16_11395 [Streptosporangiaceae bacterium]
MRPGKRRTSVLVARGTGPRVPYRASEQSDWCTGQTIRATGYTIGLYNIPRVIREVATDKPWELPAAAV